MLDASAWKDSWDTIKNVSVDHQSFTSPGIHQHAGGGVSPDGGGQMSTSTGNWLLHDWRQTLMSLTPASTLTSPLSREQALISASCGSREDRLDPQDESYEGNRETWDVKEPSGAFHFPV